MNRAQAKKILGLTGTETPKEIKSIYRKLMYDTHPDNTKDDSSTKDAAKINTAYELLKDGFAKSEVKLSKKKKAQTVWKAKENKNAFTERPILHQIEDYDGEVIGTIEVARGKYIWTMDEEFPMFLKSVYETAKDLLIEARGTGNEPTETIKQKYLADLTYLLTSQYIDGLTSLQQLATKEGSDFKVSAMLEMELDKAIPKLGTALYPAGITNHRLYIRNLSGEILGYLSFKDDRLYYVIIPLFEGRTVQVKMQVVEKKLKARSKGRYAEVALWLRLNKESKTDIESKNLKIEELLRAYAQQ